MGRRAPRKIAGAVETVLAGVQPGTLLAAVQGAWPAAVGAAIAEQAEPVSERDGVVTVACASAVWAAELDLMSPDLEARLATRIRDFAAPRLRFTASRG
jgi:predicted nucleic acid-binding Zn ribbon protein